MIDVFDDLLFASIIAAARAAGDVALGFFRPDATTSANVRYKSGNSPVSQADIAADILLKAQLGALIPDAAWLSEETPDSAERLAKSKIFIVDPIDGTRAFISGDARWAVSVALVENGRPILAVIHAPALGETFVAARGRGAWRNNGLIAAAPASLAHRLRLAAPKPLADRLAADGLIFDLVPKIPSLAYRFACVADGRIDIGLASLHSHEWDIAAADLILSEAGACLTDHAGQQIVYNQLDTTQGILIAAPQHLTLAVTARMQRVAGLAETPQPVMGDKP